MGFFVYVCFVCLFLGQEGGQGERGKEREER